MTAEDSLRATIRRTSYGVPHVLSESYVGAGFGVGYAQAQDTIGEVAEQWLTVRGERSRHLGPGGEWSPTANIDSDAFWKAVDKSNVLDRFLAENAPAGPSDEVRQLVRGYVEGYNTFLADTGVENLSDPRCRAQSWVQPITERDVFLNVIFNSVSQSSLPRIHEITTAVPPGNRPPAEGTQEALEPGVAPSKGLRGGEGASNMIALGSAATDNGRGMLFTNPHWFWNGPLALWEAHITIPGELNVYGATAGLGLPFVAFGHNEHVAWSLTNALAGRPHLIYRLTLVPGSPTSYTYDGETHEMKPHDVGVVVRVGDEYETVRRRVWETHLGRVVASTSLPWTESAAFVLADPNFHARSLNQAVLYAKARSVDDIYRAAATTVGWSWAHTIAADANGRVHFNAFLSQNHVTDEQLEKQLASDAPQALVLDGSSSASAPGSDADAPVSGIFGASRLPFLFREDYVQNSNDSYWATNPHELLEGFPRSLFGREREPLNLRTREGIAKVEERLDASDGMPGSTFSLDLLEQITMNNGVLSGRIWRDALVELCRDNAARPGFSEAGEILAAWDLTENLDSPGALLFRRFAQHALGIPEAEGRSFSSLTLAALRSFSVPFDADDPANTPNGLQREDPLVAHALERAIDDLRRAGIPLNATLRPLQFVAKEEERIPVPGGPAHIGQYNLVDGWCDWVAEEGLPPVEFGSTYLSWVQFTNFGPVARSLLTNSQAHNPSSEHYADQTRLFSEGRSKAVLFTEHEIMSDASLRVTEVFKTVKPGSCGTERV